VSSRAGQAVLVAHHSRLFREGLAAALRDAGLDDVRVADALPAATGLLQERPVKTTLCGIELAQEGVASMVAGLLDTGSASVLVLAPTIREHELLAAFEAGALGFMSREEPLDRIVYDIKGALRGEACMPRDKLAPLLRLLIDRRRLEDERMERVRRLSRRETEVLSHLSSGCSNAEIAERLFLSQATVRTHVQNILTKLEVHSRLEAIALARGDDTVLSSREIEG
jgi:DNA-binding NarL/FixJ family response regulator